MNKFDLQKLRDLPIEGVALRLGMKVQKHKALCTFHDDKHPSLSFNISKNTFKCFVCDAHGGVIDLAMQVLGKDFKEACQWLADEHNIIMSEWKPAESPKLITHDSKLITTKYSKYFARPFLNAAAHQFLFEERKLHPAVIRWFRINSWTDRQGTSWLQIPYFDINGQLIGVQNRKLTTQHSALKTPRFLFPKGSQCSIYNLPVLKMLQEEEDLWITEGCSDCWAMLSSGRKAIAIPSATLLNPKDLEVLRNHNSKLRPQNLHIFPDNDAPGERLYLQLKELFPQLERHPLPEGIKDFGEYYSKLITNNS
ncbi:MAG: hypothetical protein IKK67_03700 [Bacteroidaceae bacterium]|nr:hypothetical protein [Bacteroidaceae bacterium]